MVKTARWWAKHRSVNQAVAWLEGFEAAIQTLSENPERLGVARENPAFSYTLRQLTYGVGKKPTHRALFRICDDEVVVLSIRGLRQRDVTPKDLGSLEL